MARLLHRLGAFAARRRRTVVVAWVVVLAGLFAFAGLGGGSFADSGSIPGSPAQASLDQMDRLFPSPDGASAQIVFTAPAGHRLDEARYAQPLHATTAAAAKAPDVREVGDPLDQLSKDGHTAVADVKLRVIDDDITPKMLDGLRATGAPSSDAGIGVHFGGDAFKASASPVGPVEGLGLVVAFVVLCITLGSLLAAGLPLLTAVLGLVATVLGLVGFSSLVGIPDTALTLSVMLGLAVGIDYALFIVSRHRTQLAEGLDVDASIAHSVATAGSAVVFAGITVVIALAGLTVAGVPMLTGMGLSAAASVALAVVAALTLVPALMGLAGRRLIPKPGSRTHQRLSAAHDDNRPATMGARWVRTMVAHPVRALLAGVALLVALSIPAASLQLALSDNGSEPKGSETRVAYDLVSDAFGPGVNGPLVVLATGDHPRATAQQAREALARVDGVASVSDVQLAPNGDAARFAIVPTTGPGAPQTKALVGRLQDQAATIGASLAVTGQTAVDIDVANRLGSAVVPFTVVVVGLSLLLLMVAFRSIWIPLKATGGFLLSVGAAFGATVAVFQWGWLASMLGVSHEGPVASFMPTIVMAVLFGLAMDYEVFLVSAMREERHRTGDAKAAIVRGARGSARVVTAAAVIMVAVFASFLTSPDADIKPIAFALAVGVLVDAFVVRMTLGPAVLALLGEQAWWLPGWLERRLPNVDIEGAALEAPERIAA